MRLSWKLSGFALALGAVCACEFPAYSLGPAPTADRASGGSASGATATGGSEAGGEPAAGPCDAAACQNGSRCIPVDASYVCLCSAGFRGEYCEINPDNCEPNPCQNGSLCVDGDDTSRCECLPGWEGSTCQKNLDDCLGGPCQNGGTCSDGIQAYSCDCVSGFTGPTCDDVSRPTCKDILTSNSKAQSGIFELDPDGPGAGEDAVETLCDMTSEGGGWTLVGRELLGDTGTFKYLGVSSGDLNAAARGESSALAGSRFADLYREVRIGWNGAAEGAMFFRVTEEFFSNTTEVAKPVTHFITTDATLTGWVNDAGGAILCRASHYSTVRPGDTSWAIKPAGDLNSDCGCSSGGWLGRGAFYGGHKDETVCNGYGGGWSSVRDNGDPKGGFDSYGLEIWIR